MCIQGTDRNTAVLSNQPNQLLADVLYLVILAQESDVTLDSRLGRLSGRQVEVSLSLYDSQ